MTVFLSYAHQDNERVAVLRNELEGVAGEVWFDRGIAGGQLWWREVLGQLERCHLFVLALSKYSIRSEACLSELSYAVALARPYIAVRIDDVQLAAAPEQVRQSHVIDFSGSNVDSVRSLARAVLAAPAPRPLPDPLPEPPSMPTSYRDRFAVIFQPAMTMEEQLSVFARLRFDVNSGVHIEEAMGLLHQLYERPDLSWKVRNDIAEVFSLADTVERSPSATANTSGSSPATQAPLVDTVDRSQSPIVDEARIVGDPSETRVASISSSRMSTPEEFTKGGHPGSADGRSDSARWLIYSAVLFGTAAILAPLSLGQVWSPTEGPSGKEQQIVIFVWVTSTLLAGCAIVEVVASSSRGGRFPPSWVHTATEASSLLIGVGYFAVPFLYHFMQYPGDGFSLGFFFILVAGIAALMGGAVVIRFGWRHASAT